MFHRKRRPQSSRLDVSSASVVEALERRTLLSTFVVYSLGDASGQPGTLRAALAQSNSQQGSNTIVFAPGLSGKITLGLTQPPLMVTNSTGLTTIQGPGADVLSIDGDALGTGLVVGAAADVDLSGLTVTVSSSIFTSAVAGIMNSGTLTVRSCSIAIPGGADIDNSGTLTVTDTLLSTSNTTVSNIGIHNELTGKLSASGTTFSTMGVGLSNKGTASLTGCNFSRDTGGAVNNQGALDVTGTIFFSNQGIGGIENGGGATLTVSTSSFQIQLGSDGGAIQNDSGAAATLVNCTLAGNSATNRGGAIYSAGLLTITNCTITANQVNYPGPGGGITVAGGTAAINNSVVAANFQGPFNATASDISGTVTGGYNVIGKGGSGGLADGANGNRVGITDLKLAPLDYYGGPALTMPPLPGSPALDHGSNALALDSHGQTLQTDERGFARVFNGIVDIGAVEAQPVPLVVQSLPDGGAPPAELSLRSAMNLAAIHPGPDTVTFAPGVTGTMTIGSALQISDRGGLTTVVGPGAAALTIADNQETRVFQISAHAAALITGFTITTGPGGLGFGGGIDNSGTLTIDDMAFLNDRSTSVSGAAIMNEQGASMTVANCTFVGSVLFDETKEGGAIANAGTLSITGSTFSENGVSGFGGTTGGGAIYNTGNLTISRCNFSGSSVDANTAGGTSRGGDIDNGGTLSVSDSTFSLDSQYLQYGGGIYNSGTLHITNSSFTGDFAQYGGGAILNTGALTVDGSEFSGDSAAAAAGGVLPGGGAIENYPGATAAITSSTFVNDSTGAVGGAIANLITGNLVVVNSTFTQNSAQKGGGIYDEDALSITNCTIVGNSAGGGISVASGAAVLNNTIVATNQTDISGTVTGADNLIGTGGSGGLTNGVAGNIVGVADPKLGPLADNGGPTQTMALLSGSPAIDAGSNVLAVGPDGKPLIGDQRGFGRIFNGTVDIGAYEFGANPLGDADGDGKVDFADLVRIARHYGMTNATWSDGDFNNDGSVGFDDLLIVARNYGRTATLAADAPSSSIVAADQLPALEPLPWRRRHNRCSSSRATSTPVALA